MIKYIKKSIKRILFKNKYFCNICLSTFDAFIPYGNPSRPCTCPYCNSDERTRHLFIHLLALIYKFDKTRILHVAPEMQLQQFFRAQNNIEYFDCDLCKDDVAYKEDITRLSFPDNYFDYAICMHVLEHVYDDTRAIHELFRTIRHGGGLFLAVPLSVESHEDYSITDPTERCRLYGDATHLRNYSHELLLTRLHDAGFQIAWSSPEDFPTPVHAKYNLGSSIGSPGSRIYICTKE